MKLTFSDIFKILKVGNFDDVTGTYVDTSLVDRCRNFYNISRGICIRNSLRTYIYILLILTWNWLVGPILLEFFVGLKPV
jgi:hypothetical protein